MAHISSPAVTLPFRLTAVPGNSMALFVSGGWLMGTLRKQYDQHTGIAVTSAIAWSPGATQFIYGTYEGTVVAARSPLLKGVNPR